MDKQSFLDDLFRRMDLSKRRTPANFKYDAISLVSNSNQGFRGYGQKNEGYKNTLFVSAEPFTPGVKPKHRYAFTIQHQETFTKKSHISSNQYRKSNSSQSKPKNPMFLHVQPYKKNDKFDKIFPDVQKRRYGPIEPSTSPDLVGEYLSVGRNREFPKNQSFKNDALEALKNLNLPSKQIKSSQIIAPVSVQSPIKQLEDPKTLIKSQCLQKTSPNKIVSQSIKAAIQKQSKFLSNNYKKKQDFRKKIKQQEEKERKQKLLQRKQLQLQYMKPFNPPTNVSAYAYIIYEPELNIQWNPNSPLIKIDYSPEKTSNQINKSALQRKKSKKSKFPHSQKIVISQNSRSPVQVASLTKIMTCILALELCERFKIESQEQRIIIGKFQSNIGGTSAQISEGQIYTLQDLYYGLMLPSGNDASVAIACWGGRTLLNYEESLINKPITIHKKKACYTRFIAQMNTMGKKLGLQKTNYANSHGLVNFQNKSCAYDLAVLCEYAMNVEKFRKIVSTKFYRNTILCIPETKQSTQRLNINELTAEYLQKKSSKVLFEKSNEEDDEFEEGQARDLDSNEDDADQGKNQIEFKERTVQWENTHKLIHSNPKEYLGIKTGITTAAGPCLASCIRTSANRVFIIVVLNCDKLAGRFRDTETLKRWLYKKQGLLSPKKKGSQRIADSRSISQKLQLQSYRKDQQL